MSQEMHKPVYEKPKGIPVGDGWIQTGNYFTKELPNGGVQKMTREEFEKMRGSIGHRETVKKGLELQEVEKRRIANEAQRKAALQSAREALNKEFGKLAPGDKETRH